MKILFTSALDASFIREDLMLLERHFEVDHLFTSGFLGALKIPLRAASCTVTFTWFASAYSGVIVLFSRLFGKKAVVVIGGADVADYPEIDYGIWRSKWKAQFVRYAIRNSDKILAVDPYLHKEAMRLAAYDGRNIEYVPTGYNIEEWLPLGEKETCVLTVAKVESESRARVKGIDCLLSAAGKLPHIRFSIVGVGIHLMEKMRTSAPGNVEFVPFVERKDLLKFYQRAKVYCQPSIVEGLPNSVCEAMLCECVPVGSNVGGIPTAIRDIGFLVPYGDPDALANAIQHALDAPRSVGQAARKYIAETFPLQRREEALVRIVKELSK
ncbi:MAG: glycosyltransferase family 4 protein [Bacteroidetes bacterium]|nr:glycosyltransferase family 4 protein [Bacteroidota bacterium]MCW5895267.1 glycosyltransferase family 4 protein [Bacteroidota bacterium]